MVMVLNLYIMEDEESPLFSEGRNEKTKNNFFTIDSHGREFFGYILESNLVEQKPSYCNSMI